METLIESLASIFTLDNSYLEIVVLSLYVSVLATIVSAFFAIILASHMASSQFFGKDTITIVVNTLMSMPPVVVGLILYMVFSASGVLGFMDILYSPIIMMIAQFIIVTPIILSLSLKTLTDEYIFSVIISISNGIQPLLTFTVNLPKSLVWEKL